MLYFGAEKRERGALTKNEKSWNRVKKPDRTHHDLNVGPVDLQSTALPLSYTSPQRGFARQTLGERRFCTN